MPDYTCNFTMKNGKVVLIGLYEDRAVVTFDTELVGSIEWNIEERDRGCNIRIVLLAIDRPEFRHQGIGTKIFELINEHYGKPSFSPDDGNRRDDGSHLTGMGPDFAKAMHAKGLAFLPGYDEAEEVA